VENDDPTGKENPWLSSLFPPGGGDGTRGFVLPGVHDYDYTGQSVSGAGDVNGDGIDDLAVGAEGALQESRYSRRGASYVVFGRDTAH